MTGPFPVYDAILFDLDGTLIDTERLALAAGHAAFAALGHGDAGDLLHRLIGVDMPSAQRMITADYPGLDLTALDRHWDAAYADASAQGIPLKPGAQALLTALSQRYQLGLVTSSGRDQAMSKLDRTGLLAAFGTIVTRDDVTTPKPAPEAYLLAATRFAADPARCLVFEDSEPGARAAWAAGMRVIQVPDVIPATGRYAHHVAETLAAGALWAGLAP